MDKHKIDEKDLDFRRDIDPNSLYELTSLLGEGSYGAVYRARSRLKHEEVAIKIIPDADDDLTSLWREIRFLQVLRSPFVVSFIESLLFDNELWLVMELCDGGSLYDLKEAKKRPFTEPELQAIMAFCTLGLAHLHAQMSIHRDVKSGNILMTLDGQAKLGDFGISAQLTDTIMKRRTVIGSPYWMAPEVIQETSYDGKADIWSLGITLLELVEGSPPHFNVHPMRAIFMISSRPPPSLKDADKYSADMRDFVSKCLVKAPDHRASAKELLAHPWIRGVVKEIGPHGSPHPLLRKLVSDNWEAVEKMRAARYPPDEGTDMDMVINGGDGGGVGDMATLKVTSGGNGGTLVTGMAGTRQQLRNASLKRGESWGGTGGGTMVRHRGLSNAAPIDNNGTLRRDIGGAAGGYGCGTSGYANMGEGKDDSTLKRVVGASAGGGKKQAAHEVHAALKYFRDDPLPPLPDAKSTPSPATNTANVLPAPASAYHAEVAILDELASQHQNIPHEELKKELLQQLSQLKKQYREDLETLTRNYEQRRKNLKDALLALGSLAVDAAEGRK